MPRKDELEHYEQTEAQDILRLFEAARPSEEYRAPADFRLNVLRALSQKRGRHSPLVWLQDWATSSWVPAAAAALLVLSLGGNAWFVTQSLQTQNPTIQQTASLASGPSQSVQPAPVSAYAFQSGIVSTADLGALAATHPAIEEQVIAFGFATQPAPARSYFLGALYAEALAYLRSGDTGAASERWETIHKTVEPLAEPLAVYASRLQQLLTASTAMVAQEKSDLGVFMSLFESLYETYAGENAVQTLPLFRAGTWLTNMQLAAAAGDKVALRTPQTVAYFQQEMRRLEAPKGVLDALDQMQRVVDQKALTDRDVTALLRLVQKMQRLLG